MTSSYIVLIVYRAKERDYQVHVDHRSTNSWTEYGPFATESDAEGYANDHFEDGIHRPAISITEDGRLNLRDRQRGSTVPIPDGHIWRWFTAD